MGDGKGGGGATRIWEPLGLNAYLNPGYFLSCASVIW